MTQEEIIENNRKAAQERNVELKQQAAEIFMQMKLDAACGDANLEVNEVHDFKQKEELIF